MFTRQNLVRLLLACLLLALLVVPVFGAVGGSSLAVTGSPESTVYHQTMPGDGSGVAIACVPGDPGGGGGDGC